MEKAAEASGSRFAYLMGDLVMVQLALVRFAVETVREEGFEPVVPPVLVREGALYGTGFFPGEREMIYEVRARRALPRRHLRGLARPRCTPARSSMARRCRSATPASRPASGARPAPPGKDTRGIFRVHQFDKVEMFSFVEPEDAAAEHERILAIEERILAALEIPYRVVDIPVGDLGAPAARKFDCEAWIPSQERYRELTSTLEHDRLPGAPARRPFPPRRRGAAAAPPHAERDRRRGRPHADRADRERPAGGRVGRAAAGAGRGRRARVDRHRQS